MVYFILDVYLCIIPTINDVTKINNMVSCYDNILLMLLCRYLTNNCFITFKVNREKIKILIFFFLNAYFEVVYLRTKLNIYFKYFLFMYLLILVDVMHVKIGIMVIVWNNKKVVKTYQALFCDVCS